MNPAACASICRPNGVIVETLSARTSDTASTATTRRTPARRRRGGVPGRATPSRPGRPGTICRHADRSHTEAESSPPRARLAIWEHATLIQATGRDDGVVSRARMRCRPSPAGSIESAAECSARRRRSS
jgi:hypothetical protein